MVVAGRLATASGNRSRGRWELEMWLLLLSSTAVPMLNVSCAFDGWIGILLCFLALYANACGDLWNRWWNAWRQFVGCERPMLALAWENKRQQRDSASCTYIRWNSAPPSPPCFFSDVICQSVLWQNLRIDLYEWLSLVWTKQLCSHIANRLLEETSTL